MACKNGLHSSEFLLVPTIFFNLKCITCIQLLLWSPDMRRGKRKKGVISGLPGGITEVGSRVRLSETQHTFISKVSEARSETIRVSWCC